MKQLYALHDLLFSLNIPTIDPRYDVYEIFALKLWLWQLLKVNKNMRTNIAELNYYIHGIPLDILS